MISSKSKQFINIKPGWKEYVKPYKDECNFWYQVWKSAGKPTHGALHDYMREAKRQYTYSVRRIKRRENAIRLEKLSQCILESNSRDFFRELKKMRPKRVAPSINCLSDSKDIADCFAQKYRDLYNSNPSNLDFVDEYIKTQMKGNNTMTTKISASTVSDAVHSLKQNKNDGDKGFLSNHLIYASQLYFESLAYLLTAIFNHGYVPETLLLATIVSIPKDNLADICNDTNYRGIALSSSIGKVFDKILLQKNSNVLKTSNLQFAYKEKHGTAMCTLALKEVVKYYLDRKTDVFACFVDASKAFDKIRHDKLFELLIKRGVSAVDLRVLLNLYRRQRVRTVWQNEHSASFPATNGIRQGSISSPILFCCYMDELILRLQQKGTC